MIRLTFFLLTILALHSQAATAQTNDNFIIKLNKEVLLRAPAEQNLPVVRISKNATLGKHQLSIQYTTTDAQSGWNRIFTFNDASEKTHKRVEMKNQNGTVSFNAKDLRKAALANQPVILYTTSLPKDPEQAALVRVRRFELCKIEWK